MAEDLIALAMAFAALLISLVGFVHTRAQLRRARLSERGLLFKELYQRFLDDEDMNYVYSLAEREENLFSQSHGTADLQERHHRRRAIERLLSHLEVICALYRNRLLAPEDMWHFRYSIQRLNQYTGFDGYRDFLEEDWPRRRKPERGPYSNLFWYIDNELRNALKAHGDSG